MVFRAVNGKAGIGVGAGEEDVRLCQVLVSAVCCFGTWCLGIRRFEDLAAPYSPTP